MVAFIGEVTETFVFVDEAEVVRPRGRFGVFLAFLLGVFCRDLGNKGGVLVILLILSSPSIRESKESTVSCGLVEFERRRLFMEMISLSFECCPEPLKDAKIL